MVEIRAGRWGGAATATSLAEARRHYADEAVIGVLGQGGVARFHLGPSATPMTAERLALAKLLEKAGDGDFLRAVAEAVLRLLMENGVEGLIGVAGHELSPDRVNYRNGYRDRTLDTRLGTLALRVPKLRQGSYFRPSWRRAG